MACGGKTTYPLASPRPKRSEGVTLEDDVFDLTTSEITGKLTPVARYIWKNENEMKVSMIDFGASIISIEVPDKKGNVEDVVLGLPTFDQYKMKSSYFFGATIGRVTNRIANAALTIRGRTFRLTANLPPHYTDGGENGFNKALWSSHIEHKKVIMSLHSPDSDEGFPGDLIVNATFELTDDNEFYMEYRAYTTKPTWVNLTNHTYFNLAGHDQGAEELYDHNFTINAEYISEVNRLMIPTGHRLSIDRTPFDLRIPMSLREILNKNPHVIGLDHNYCITKGEYQQDTFVARVQHPQSGRIMELYSNQPTVQFYTANRLPIPHANYKGDPKKIDVILGKGNKNYQRHSGFCLCPQFYPDAINHQEKFSKFILNPGDIYFNTIRYKFLTQK